MNNKDDKFLVEHVLKGDVNSFGFIVERYKNRSFNLAVKICGNREDAEEIVQDSFLKAYRSLGGFRMESNFATWLYRIVFNTAVSQKRNNDENTMPLEDAMPEVYDCSNADGNKNEFDNERRKLLINFALGKLNEVDRGLITFMYYDDLTVEEMTEITGMSASNIKVRLHRSRQKLLEILTKIQHNESI
jgi:RNA polymerase sigma-70 factor (ECF subfamily)